MAVPTPAPPAPVRLVVVDHHPVWREGVRAIVACRPELRLVGEAAVAADAVPLVERVRPAVVLLDPTIRAAGRPAGLALCRELHERCPHSRVLVLSPVDDDACVSAAVAAGVAGYLHKEVGVDRLVAAVLAVSDGRSAMDRTSAAAMLRVGGGRPADGLSERQLDVLRLLARGMSNREIALALALSEGTVKFHLAKILRHLGVTRRVAAVVAAGRRGLV